MSSDSANKTTGLLSPVAFGVGAFLLAMSPWVRGGNRHVALLVLECLALTWLVWQIWGQTRRINTPVDQVSRPVLESAEAWLLGLPIFIALVQLVPLPAWVLSGPRPWGALSSASWAPVSVAPDYTLTSLMAALPLAVAYLLGRWVSQRQLLWLVRLLLCLGGGVALMGLLQKAHFGEWLYFDAEFAGSAIGPFANHNHFADWLLMLLPLAGWRIREQFGHRSTNRVNWLPLTGWLMLLMLLLVAMVASASRSGVGVGLLVLGVSAWALWWKPGLFSRHKWKVMGTVLAGLAVMALLVDPAGLTGRLGSRSLMSDAAIRWGLTVSTWQAALAYLPLGSGLGTYAVAYPAFQPTALGSMFPHAHNDYVQYWMELGLIFPAVLWVMYRVVSPRLSEWRSWMQHSKRPKEYMLQGMCWLGFAGIALHSWMDFNFRIPANAILAALLLGIACRPIDKPLHPPHAVREEGQGSTPIIPGRKPHRHRRGWLGRIRNRFGFD